MAGLSGWGAPESAGWVFLPWAGECWVKAAPLAKGVPPGAALDIQHPALSLGGPRQGRAEHKRLELPPSP